MGLASPDQVSLGVLVSTVSWDAIDAADRGFYSYEAWGEAAASRAALLWRAPTQLELPLVEVASDGTYASALVNPKLRGALRPWRSR
jgi:hypothetical protein